MVLRAGDKILAVHRRLFESDASRLFVASVEACEQGIVKARGYTFAWGSLEGRYLRKDDERVKILSLASGSLIVYELPGGTDVAAVSVECRDGSRVLVREGGLLLLDLSERPH